MKLKSGTDIRGIASENPERKNIELTDEVIRKISLGFSCFLQQKTGKNLAELTVAIGRDSRISGPRICETVTQTLLSCGINVIDCGLCSTPAMFMTTIDLNADASIEITASHHPFYRNGLKFFTKDGGFDGGDIEFILRLAEEQKDLPQNIHGNFKKTDYMSQYANRLCELIKKGVDDKYYDYPLRGFHIVVDAGNGVGGFYAKDVLEKLGADTSGSRFLEPDGMFPNHVPNPEDETAMASVCEAVLKSQADLGVIFDTDVDRAGAVSSDGAEINRNRLVAIASVIALEGNDDGTIVTDSITSSGLKTFIEETLKAHHHRYKRGYKNVINEAIRLNEFGHNCPLAIETSGHAAMRENYFLDDGAYLVTKIIIKMAQLKKEGKTLSDLYADLKEPVESREIRLKITESDFKAYGEKVIRKLTAYAREQQGMVVADDSFEGVRVSFDKENGNGWFLLRLSVHDPIMPLNVESDEAGGVETILSKLMPFILSCEGLQIPN
ncbi:MAG: phosphomannomutase/phosphoglucomutase [Bacillota bacterium]|nr:phosphomannomutase/phosphoglucomutase [Bacillota bacterium]